MGEFAPVSGFKGVERGAEPLEHATDTIAEMERVGCSLFFRVDVLRIADRMEGGASHCGALDRGALTEQSFC
jgi:hypothetical protein